MIHRDETGLTLIEVMIALLIFAVGALGALSLTGYIYQNHQDSRNIGEGTNVGRAELERIMGLRGAALQACTEGTDCDAGMGCTQVDCWKEISSTGEVGGMLYQVDNTRRLGVGGMVQIEVAVRYPRDRDKRGLIRGDAGWVDCLGDAMAPSSQGLCRQLFFYNQKVP